MFGNEVLSFDEILAHYNAVQRADLLMIYIPWLRRLCVICEARISERAEVRDNSYTRGYSPLCKSTVPTPHRPVDAESGLKEKNEICPV